MRLAEITLIKKTASGRDSLGQVTYTTSEKTVIAETLPQSRSEFFMAGQIGITADIAFRISYFDYTNELAFRYNGQVYRIYRKYEVDDAHIEIYGELTSGLNDAEDEEDEDNDDN